MVAYWPTRVHDHQTALKQSTAGGSYAMSTAWPSPERLPAAVERSGAPSSTLGCTTDDVVANRSDASGCPAALPTHPPGVDWCSTPAHACMWCDLCCLLRGSPCWPRPPFAPAQALRLVLFACLPCPACPACTSTIELHLYLCKTVHTALQVVVAGCSCRRTTSSARCVDGVARRVWRHPYLIPRSSCTSSYWSTRHFVTLTS